jgi:hypothetical protein
MIALTLLAIALLCLATAPSYLGWSVQSYAAEQPATEQDMGQDWGDLWDDLHRDIRPKRKARKPRKVGATHPELTMVQLRSMRVIPTCMQAPHANDG